MIKIWIVSPFGYPHSHAFDEVALAFCSAFRALGHKASIVREASGLGEMTIILGCNLLPYVDLPRTGRFILVNLEQITPGSPWLTTEYLSLLKSHTVWDYSDRNVKELARLGIASIRCGIGYVPELTRITSAQETTDVLFFGSMNERRNRVLQQLSRAGAHVETRFNIYGQVRDDLIARSKIVLNVHYYESRVLEIVRVSYLLANRKCVVSESGLDDSIENPLKDGIAFVPYENLALTCLQLLKDERKRRTLAQSGFNCISALSQIDYLRKALAATP